MIIDRYILFYIVNIGILNCKDCYYIENYLLLQLFMIIGVCFKIERLMFGEFFYLMNGIIFIF